MEVLLIDDDEDTTFLMGVMLSKSDVVRRYSIESSAKRAIESLQQSSRIPDCIFVDLEMPEMGGFEFIEKFENLFGTNFPRTQIFVLSSSVRLSDQERALKYKLVKEFLVKPLSYKKLIDINEGLALRK